MAQKVNIVLVDDLDGSEASETVSFALDGKDYTIDLNDENAQKLRDAMAPFVAHGEKSTRRGGGRRSAASSSSAAAANGGPSAAEIRVWARENGWDVPERGRVAAEVRDAYSAAH